MPADMLREKIFNKIFKALLNICEYFIPFRLNLTNKLYRILDLIFI